MSLTRLPEQTRFPITVVHTHTIRSYIGQMQKVFVSPLHSCLVFFVLFFIKILHLVQPVSEQFIHTVAVLFMKKENLSCTV